MKKRRVAQTTRQFREEKRPITDSKHFLAFPKTHGQRYCCTRLFIFAGARFG